MKNLLPALALGFLIAVIGLIFFFSPYGQKLEEDIGLALLFKLRGPRPPPEEIVIVNLDQISSQKLGLPENFSKWPRTIHARLVNFLQEQGAAVIAFDVHFVENRGLDGDKAFAKSIRQAGNVVLFERIQRETRTLPGGGTTGGTLEVDRVIPPLPLLADSALALAPFPLPKLPVRVNQSWIIKTSAGERLTLPAAVLQVLGMKYVDRLQQMVEAEIDSADYSVSPESAEVPFERDIQKFGQRMRALFMQQPDLAERLLSKLAPGSPLLFAKEERLILQAMLRLYAGANSIYLNYYGPPATLPTYSYHELLSEGSMSDARRPEVEFKNKIVFVGAARNSWSGQKDGFYTVFSQPDGLDLSGVELAATAFANLYEAMPIEALSSELSFYVLVLVGLCVTLCCWCASPVMAFFLLAGFILCYLIASRSFFSTHGIWPPLLIPLAVQPLTAFLTALYLKYRIAGKERENIRKALNFYLPEKAVNALAKDLSFIKEGDQMVYSVCLMTDARNYTTLSERLDPRGLSILMKEYYRHLFTPVNTMGGVVSDVVGDSMLALWPSTKPESALRKRCCQAALQIAKEVEVFNQQHSQSRLPTGIGIHFGYILMGNMGAGNHFEYAPVGDIVNTVSRIEGLNKYLGTNILATEEVVAGLMGITTRNLGAFVLAGKSKPIIIHELLVASETLLEKNIKAVCELFATGLNYYREMRWEEAIAVFLQCSALKTDDGPTLFYLNLCRQYSKSPPGPSWDGVVFIEKK